MAAKQILPSFKSWWSLRPSLGLSLIFLLLALLSLPILDLEVYRVDPWQELGRIGVGIVMPTWSDWNTLAQAILYTLAFAFAAVLPAVVIGSVLALIYRFWFVRVLCAAIRSVHEIFWGLIFMQVFGISALTGILAIAVPYSGIFARVFADIFGHQSPLPRLTLARGGAVVSTWLYTTVAQSWQQLSTYVRYRFECALRSSTILGFVGLPTLGFYFESAFKEGHYSEAAGLLWLFILLIATLRWWLRRRLIPLYCLAAYLVLPDSTAVSANYLWHFVSSDIWPSIFKEQGLTATLQWYWREIVDVIAPAAAYTVALSLVALVGTGLLVLLFFPSAARVSAGRLSPLGHSLLILLRSVPELVLAFVLMLLFGPSALPGILALAIHNSGLISYLIARDADELSFRPDRHVGANLWSYELVPRLYPRICALLFYRWEVIMRESTILGILGITTLGFYVDSAFAEIRYDKAFLLIVATALLNIAVDALVHWLNRKIRLAKGVWHEG